MLLYSRMLIVTVDQGLVRAFLAELEGTGGQHRRLLRVAVRHPRHPDDVIKLFKMFDVTTRGPQTLGLKKRDLLANDASALLKENEHAYVGDFPSAKMTQAADIMCVDANSPTRRKTTRRGAPEQMLH